jgi:hypothetical protein
MALKIAASLLFMGLPLFLCTQKIGVKFCEKIGKNVHLL